MKGVGLIGSIRLSTPGAVVLDGYRIPMDSSKTPISWTVSFWISVGEPSDSKRNIVYWGSSDEEPSPGIFLLENSNSVQVCMNDTTITVSEDKFPDSKCRYHFCLSISGKFVRIFVNGVLQVTEKLKKDPVFDTDAPFYVGSKGYACNGINLKYLKCYPAALERDTDVYREIGQFCLSESIDTLGSVAFFRLNDISGTEVTEGYRKGYNAKYVHKIGFKVSGPFGEPAIHLEDGCVEVPYSEMLNRKDFSLSLWMKPVALQEEKKYCVLKNSGYALLLDYQRLYIEWSADQTTLTIVEAVVENRWIHVVCTFGNSTLISYVNGKKKTERKNMTEIAVEKVALLIGSQTSELAHQFEGDVALVSMYDRQLSENEVESLFDNWTVVKNGASDIFLNVVDCLENERKDCLKFRYMLQARSFCLEWQEQQETIAGSETVFSIGCIESEEIHVPVDSFHAIVREVESNVIEQLQVKEDMKFTWIPKKVGEYKIEVFLGDIDGHRTFVGNGEVTMNIVPSSISSVSAKADPPKEQTAGSHQIVMVQALDNYGNRLVTGGDADSIKVDGLKYNVYERKESGTYDIDLMPEKVGDFLCKVYVVNGIGEISFPFNVLPGPISVSMCKLERRIGDMKLLIPQEIKIRTFDFYENEVSGYQGDFSVQLQRHDPVDAIFTNGVYSCTIRPETYGIHEIWGEYKGRENWGAKKFGSCKVDVLPATSWTTDEVPIWLEHIGFGQYSKGFVDAGVTGSFLVVTMTFNMLVVIVPPFPDCQAILLRRTDLQTLIIDSHATPDDSFPDVIGERYRVVSVEKEYKKGNAVVVGKDNIAGTKCVLKLIADKSIWETEVKVLREFAESNYVIKMLNCFEDTICGKVSYVIVLERGYQSAAVYISYMESINMMTRPVRMNMMSQIVAALLEVERKGYTQGDIKLDNFLIMEHTMALKLIDFDHAKKLDSEGVTEWTPPYMPPEVAKYVERKNGDVAPIASVSMDSWSVGIIGLELVLGSHPLDSVSNIPEFLAGLPKDSMFPLPPSLSSRTVNRDEFLEAYSFLRRCLTVNPVTRTPLKELRDHPFAGGTKYSRTMITGRDPYAFEGELKKDIMDGLEELKGFMKGAEIQRQTDNVVLQEVLRRMNERLGAIATADAAVKSIDEVAEEKLKEHIVYFEGVVSRIVGDKSEKLEKQLHVMAKDATIDRDKIKKCITDVKSLLETQTERMDIIIEEQKNYASVVKNLRKVVTAALQNNPGELQNSFTEDLKEKVLEAVKQQNGDLISASLQSLENTVMRQSMGQNILDQVKKLQGDVFDIRSRMNRKDLVVNVTYWEKETDDKKLQSKKKHVYLDKSGFFECKVRMLEKERQPAIHCRHVRDRKLKLVIFSDENAAFKVTSCEKVFLENTQRLIDGGGDAIGEQLEETQLPCTIVENVGGRIGVTEVEVQLPDDKLPPFLTVPSKKGEFVRCRLRLDLSVTSDVRESEVLRFVHDVHFVVHDEGDFKGVLEKKDSETGKPRSNPHWQDERIMRDRRYSDFFLKHQGFLKYGKIILSGIMLFLVML